VVLKEVNIAEYHPQSLAEHQGNPLLEALPPPKGKEQVVSALRKIGSCSEDERLLPLGTRKLCLTRIDDYFQPMAHHLDLEARISRCIRSGYARRNPVFPEYASSLAQGYRVLRDGECRTGHDAFKSQSCGFALIGMSGMRKTTSVNAVLNLYPQVIRHTMYKGAPLNMTQITWVMVDCPPDSTLKGLCSSFYKAIDDLLGTEYSKRFGERTTVNAMLVHMNQLSALYSLGVLVIDEIQNLAKTGGAAKLLNYFMSLINTLGVPVVLIGTHEAEQILRSEFRLARRVSGQGDIIWGMAKNDSNWKLFIWQLFLMQWVKVRAECTEEIIDVMHELSQGIIDLAIKIYICAQEEALSNGTETFGVAELRAASKSKLVYLSPALDAIKKRDREVGALQRLAASHAATVNSPFPRNMKKSL
jgi:hypothetical protein